MKTILFVCWHNSGRSQMAEVYFNVNNKDPNIEAISAWTWIKGDWLINPRVVKLLKSKWIDILNQLKKYEPKVLTNDMIKKADKIYTMWCMDNCFVWDREVDFDFWLDDPASDDTDLENMWNDFEEKMKNII